MHIKVYTYTYKFYFKIIIVQTDLKRNLYAIAKFVAQYGLLKTPKQ